MAINVGNFWDKLLERMGLFLLKMLATRRWSLLVSKSHEGTSKQLWQDMAHAANACSTFCYRRQSLRGSRKPGSSLPYREQVHSYCVLSTFLILPVIFNLPQRRLKFATSIISYKHFSSWFFGNIMGFFSLYSANSARLGAYNILTVLYT